MFLVMGAVSIVMVKTLPKLLMLTWKKPIVMATA